MNFLLKGILIGIILSAPLSQISALCVQRTLQKNVLSGFVTGLGSAVANMIYGFGMAVAVSSTLKYFYVFEMSFDLLAFVALSYFAYRIANLKKDVNPESLDKLLYKKLSGNFVSAFFKEMENVVMIAIYPAIFVGLDLIKEASLDDGALVVVLGIFIGSVLWWYGLSNVALKYKSKFTLKYMNHIIASIVFIFALNTFLN